MIVGKETERQRIVQQLESVLAPLTAGQRQLLLANITTRKCRKSEVIYHERDIPEYLFCLLKGKVKIYIEGVGGRSQIVRMPRPMGFFGYRAGFANDRYSTTAAAVEASTLCLIPLPVIKQIIQENSQVAVFFIQQLATHLGHADQQTVNLTQKHIRGRLAEGLLRLKEHYGTEGDGRTLGISLSREDLASLSNMTTSNAIRTLSAFAAEALVSLDGRRITLLDEEALLRISKIG